MLREGKNDCCIAFALCSKADDVELLAAIARIPSYKLAYIKDDLTEKCTAILLGYRKHCAASTAPSQVRFLRLFLAVRSHDV